MWLHIIRWWKSGRRTSIILRYTHATGRGSCWREMTTAMTMMSTLTKQCQRPKCQRTKVHIIFAQIYSRKAQNYFGTLLRNLRDERVKLGKRRAHTQEHNSQKINKWKKHEKYRMFFLLFYSEIILHKFTLFVDEPIWSRFTCDLTLDKTHENWKNNNNRGGSR